MIGRQLQCSFFCITLHVLIKVYVYKLHKHLSNVLFNINYIFMDMSTSAKVLIINWRNLKMFSFLVFSKCSFLTYFLMFALFPVKGPILVIEQVKMILLKGTNEITINNYYNEYLYESKFLDALFLKIYC